MIERKRERKHSAHIHEAIRRLETNDAAERRGLANRSARVSAERSETHAGCDCGGRTTGRSTCDAFEVPRIVNRTKVGRRRSAAPRKLLHVLFANQHRARALQTSYDFRVFVWNPLGEEGTRARCSHACRVDEILQTYRDAV
jgi:hypothetical protein